MLESFLYGNNYNVFPTKYFQVRLFLSSKSEQNSVIAARKNNTYTSPVYKEYVPPVPSQPTPAQEQNWNSQTAGNPYAAKAGYEASYPPQNSNATRTSFNNQNSYSNRQEISQVLVFKKKKAREF